MTILRIEYVSLGGGRGRLGGQVDAREEEPIGAATLTVTTTPTASAGRPVVPSGSGTIFAEFASFGAPVYVDIAAAPDPAAEPRLLIWPGRIQRVHATSGHFVAAMLAADVPQAASSTADRSSTLSTVVTGGYRQDACAANLARRFLQIANPDQSNGFWWRADDADASNAPGSTYCGPGGTFVFDTVVPNGRVSVFGPVSGQPFTVKEA